MVVCDLLEARTVRWLAAGEFDLLAQREAGCFYRPRSEIQRMLTVGEAWGLCGARGEPLAAQMLLPLNADLLAASALREYLHTGAVQGGYFLAPPVLCGQENALHCLAEAVFRRGAQLARGRSLWAVLECTAQAGALTELYLQQGMELRAVRPLVGLAPCFLFAKSGGPRYGEPLWVPLDDWSRVARALAQGRTGTATRQTPQGRLLGLK